MDGSEEELLTYPRPVGEGIGFREEPIELTPVRARVFKSDLEMLSHIYKENISAEKGLAMLEQRDHAVAATAATEQRHDSLQSYSDLDVALVMAAAAQAAAQQQT